MNMPQQPPPGYHGPPPGQRPGQPPGPPQGPHPGQPPGPHPGPPPTEQFYPMQYGPRPPAQQPRSPMAKTTAAVWTFGLISVAATVIGLSVNENGANAWHSVHAWGAVAIVGAVLTLTPAFGSATGLTPHRAWQAAACGAAALLLFWVLFVLPAVGSNTSLIVTIGAAAGVVAAWIAPGRDAGVGPQGHTW